MDFKEERLADTVNKPPVVFMDCTAPQIGMVALIAGPSGLLLGIVLGILFGKITLGLALGIVLALVIGYTCLYFIQVNRERYYESWLEEQIFLKRTAFSESTGFGQSTMISGSKRYGRRSRK